MDAQNATESASAKPTVASSPKLPARNTDQAKPIGSAKPAAPARPSQPNDIDSRVVARDGDKKPAATEDDGPVDVSSEAETVVLPGKDGHSPSKIRKPIKIEDRIENRDDDEGSAKKVSDRGGNSTRGLHDRERASGREKAGEKPMKSESSSAVASTGTATPLSGGTLGVNKKKSQHEKARSKDGSSGLSSAPTSPPPSGAPRRSPKLAEESDAESMTARSSKITSKDKTRPNEKPNSHKRKALKAESDDDGASRKARRQRASVSGSDAPDLTSKTSLQRDARPSVSKTTENSASSVARSVSPHPRGHRRSISTQLPNQSSNGLSHKKKRVPAPLQSTDYNSDESSASNSPHPRSSKLRGLATPATGDSNISPAKLAPHKKHVDAHGQTFLARACARGEYDNAKTRLTERPEDLNHPDYAGNSPLQIAAINGYAEIVKLLVEAGCNLDCMNNDKDTPLLDAVDNDHLNVVKVLLDAGVNPRKANVNGEEPLDRIRDDQDNAAEIRAALVAARQNMGDRRRASEDHQDHDTHSSHGAESPRRSPGLGGSSAGPGSLRRGGTVRANKTSNHLLYMPMDDKTLRQAAGRGDQETVERILQVRDSFDDPESMVAAARGGHDIIMELLLALGGANPDPPPVHGLPPDVGTPILAAIGQENIQVIKLLLSQNHSKFDPTRRFKGEAYYEIARKRQGTNWKEEEELLKAAYDEYKKLKGKGGSQHKSPNRSKDGEREAKRARTEAKDPAERPHKRRAASPTRDTVKAGSGKSLTSPRDRRRTESFSTHADDQISPKRGPGRPRKEERASTMAVTDAGPAKHVSKAKPVESEAVVAASSDGEALKPRRKLVSGRELKGERERQRHPSVTSNASSLKEPSSPKDTRHDSPSEKKVIKVLDRTKALKKDESKGRQASADEGPTKRHRSSATPPHHGSDKDVPEVPPKRRKLEADSNQTRSRPTGSPEDRTAKSAVPRDTASSSSKAAHRERDEANPKTLAKSKGRDAPADSTRREAGKSLSSEKGTHAASDEPDIEMRDAQPPLKAEDERKSLEARLKKEDEEQKRAADQEALAAEKKRKDAEQKRVDEEEQRRKEAEQARQRAEDEARRKKEEADAAAKQREEEERLRKEGEARKKLEEEERKRREMEEAEALRREDERKRQEEEERRQREEEERLQREQLEREAAEEARRRKEEEERRERMMREEAERRRAAREAEVRRMREEQERIRLAKLPPLLRWLDQCPNPKLANIAEKFSLMQGVRFDCIRPERTGHPDGREQWLLNTQVALLIGEKDLELSRCEWQGKVPRQHGSA
jgi:ankyrin repeat protein